MKHYSSDLAIVWDPINTFYEFFISPTRRILTSIEFEDIVSKFIEFHRDYHDLSRKFGIGQIFDKSYLEWKNQDINTVFFDSLEEFLILDSISFFPINQNVGDIEMMFPSYISHHDQHGNIVGDQVYGIVTSEELNTYCKLDYWQQGKHLPDNVINFNFESGQKINLNFDEEMVFRIEVLSNLFFPVIETGYLKFPDKYQFGEEVDNRSIAYRNAPRFNSFLRDLKQLFIEKYEWGFRFCQNDNESKILRFLHEDGILIDDVIVYQEDIDSGKVKIPY